jgi:nitrogen fixation protein FixH
MKEVAIEEEKNAEFRLTGGIVLIALVIFFVVVMIVNGVMAYLAVETFSGIQTDKPYESGLAFNKDIARARAQDAQGWIVDENVTRVATGEVSIRVQIKDSTSQAVTGLSVKSTLKAPVDSHNDCKVALTEKGDGIYVGVGSCVAGQWDVETLALRGEDVAYKSINRIILH